MNKNFHRSIQMIISNKNTAILMIYSFYAIICEQKWAVFRVDTKLLLNLSIRYDFQVKTLIFFLALTHLLLLRQVGRVLSSARGLCLAQPLQHLVEGGGVKTERCVLRSHQLTRDEHEERADLRSGEAALLLFCHTFH